MNINNIKFKHPSLWKFPAQRINREPSNLNKCEICGRVFGNLSLKEEHMQRHFESAKADGLTPFFRYKKGDDLDRPSGIGFRSSFEDWA